MTPQKTVFHVPLNLALKATRALARKFVPADGGLPRLLLIANVKVEIGANVTVCRPGQSEGGVGQPDARVRLRGAALHTQTEIQQTVVRALDEHRH